MHLASVVSRRLAGLAVWAVVESSHGRVKTHGGDHTVITFFSEKNTSGGSWRAWERAKQGAFQGMQNKTMIPWHVFEGRFALCVAWIRTPQFSPLCQVGGAKHPALRIWVFFWTGKGLSSALDSEQDSNDLRVGGRICCYALEDERSFIALGWKTPVWSSSWVHLSSDHVIRADLRRDQVMIDHENRSLPQRRGGTCGPVWPRGGGGGDWRW